MGALTGHQVLVTGATGFIGSHLVQALIAQKAHIVAFHRSSDASSYFYQKALHKKVLLVAGDVCDYERILEVVTRYNVSYIFHLAAQTLVESAYHNPRHTIETNILGTVAVLEAARVYSHIKGVLVTSSDKAYGKKRTPYTEKDPLRGDHPYEVSKSAADLIATAYFRTYGVPVVTTRFGNVYGEGDLNTSRIIPGIMQAVLNKEALIIRSDGTFVRDYVYVKDVVRGCIELLSSIETTKGEAFNLSSEESYSVLELVNEISKLLKKKIPYTIVNTQKNEIPYQSLNYKKAATMIGYQSHYNLSRVTQKMYGWYKSIFS